MAKELNSSAETRGRVDKGAEKMSSRVARGAEKMSAKEEGESDVRNVDGVHEQWEKNGSFHIQYVPEAILIGCNATDGLVVQSTGERHNCVYVTDVTDRRRNRMKEVIMNYGETEYSVHSYASLADGRNVVGTSDGNIDFYDHDWKHIARVNAYGTSLLSSGYQSIIVTVDKDGMILATNYGGSTVLIVDPGNRQIVKHFRVIDKEAKPIHSMATLSTSYLAILTKCAEGNNIAVVDKSGVVKATSHSHGKIPYRLAIDRSCDVIYVMLRDEHFEHFIIEAISVPCPIVGNMSTTSVIKYTGVDLPYYMSFRSFVIPDPGKIFILDGTHVTSFRRV